MLNRFIAVFLVIFIPVLLGQPAAAKQPANPQVAMVKKAMPAVVGIGIDRRTKIGFRFTGDNSFWEEFQKQYKREQGEFSKKSKPQWDQEKDTVTPDDIAVVGSGFIVDKNGTVVTADHVVSGHRTVYITTWDNKVYRATVTKTSKDNDVAVLKIDGATGEFPYMVMGNSDNVEIAEPVVGIGNPFGQTFSVSGGIVSALNRSLGEGTSGLIQTDAPLNPGNSGGPLINMDGEVIGVSHAIYSPGKGEGGQAFNVGLAYAVPVNRVKDLLSYSGNAGNKVYIGITLAMRGEAVFIDEVEEGSPAAAAGMESGDRIVSIDGKRVGNSESVLSVLRAKKVGDIAEFQVNRDGRNRNIKIILAKQV